MVTFCMGNFFFGYFQKFDFAEIFFFSSRNEMLIQFLFELHLLSATMMLRSS